MGNDPLNKTDPTGQFSLIQAGAVLIVSGIITYKLYAAAHTEQKHEKIAKEKQDANAARDEAYLRKMNGENISASEINKVGADAIKADKAWVDSAAELVKDTHDVTTIEIPSGATETITQAVTETVQAVTEKLTSKDEAPQPPPVEEKKK